MQLNGVDVVQRFNRPGTLQRVLLKTNFIVNGSFTDPYDVSCVTLFRKTANTSPSSVLVSSTQLLSASSFDQIKFHWEPSGALGTYADCLHPSSYSDGGLTTSSIFRLDTGQYVVVLDGVNDVSSVRLGDVEIRNQASAAGEYIDVWTAKMTANSDYQVFINNLELFQDSVVTTVEEVLLKPRHKLLTNRVKLNEVVDMKITTDITVQNRNIEDSLKNLFTQSIITNPKIEIVKENREESLPSRVTVKSFADTSAVVEVTSDNTVIYNFDTSVLTNGSITDLGSAHGDYYVRMQYTLLNETLFTERMHFTIG